MQGKEKIIEDILSSAKKTAQAMIDEAAAQTEEQVNSLRESLDAALRESEAKAKAEAEALYAGQVKLGELEAGKALLKAKQACVSAVYDGVRDRILAAPDAEYLEIIKSYIVASCEDGDEVIAAKRDEKRVTAAWLKKVSDAAKKKLTLSKEYGDFSGGVVLRNSRYDRSLTVDEIVADLKERTLAETVRALGI